MKVDPGGVLAVDLWLRARAKACCCGATKADGGGSSGGDFPLIEPGASNVRDFRREVGVTLDDMLDRLLKVLRPGMDRHTAAVAVANELANPKWVSEFASAFEPIVAELFDRGALDGATRIGTVWDGDVPEVDRWIGNATTRLAEDVRNGTVSEVQDLIGEAFDRGDGMRGVIRELREQGFDRFRAERIARTETVRAYSQGQMEAWRQSGRVTGKKWSLSPSACAFCQLAAAQYGTQAIGLDDAFFALGSTLQVEDGRTMKLDYEAITAPPLHPHCRCSLIPVMET